MTGAIDRAEVRRRTRKLFAAESSLMAWRQWLRIQICPFEKLLPHVPPGCRLLDVGCGGGLFLGLLALGDPTLSATGFDRSGDAIACATRMAKRLDLDGLTFSQVQNASCWSQEQYSMVSMIDILHHVSPQQRQWFFHEAAKRVAEGGHLICKEMRPHPRWKAAANVLHDLIVARQWVRHSSGSTIESWGLEAHLRLVWHEEWDQLWYAHGLWVFQRKT